MATSDLVSMMEREREKYREQRDRARTELAEAERWLEKIDAFLAEETRDARDEKKKGTRARAASAATAKIRQDVLDAIGQNPTTGVAAKDLYGMLTPLGYNKSGINAALFQLSKEGTIKQSGRRQPYKVVRGTSGAATTHEADETPVQER